MRLRRSLSLLVLVVSFALPVTASRAATPANAASFIENLVSQAIDLLNNKQMPEQERERRFDALLSRNFDIPRISRFVLGRYWRTASPQERQRFTDLFERWIIRTYSARFSEYSGETVKVTGSRDESETSTIVSSQLLRPNGAPPAKLDWRVRKENGGYKIVDVDVEGVSMALTQRDEFASVIQRSGGTVASLNHALEQKLADGDTVPTKTR
jgi:phospholipid transport system substrate-binding protein